MRTTLILLVLLTLAAAHAPAQVVVIANRSVGESSLTPSQVLEIYLLNVRAWGDGQAVTLMCLRENEQVERKFFGILRRTPLEMRKVWLRAQLSGHARPPEMITLEEDMVKRVAATPGAIGFVSKDKVQGNVKILLVID
jgi:hypothetical protein